ncbi:hypothetical protein DFQ29_002459 [Apophysomyces sp. BC1021]|nr:hypothetical protein DFQ29_002459 [Apophysomyces sp. BC1021]
MSNILTCCCGADAKSPDEDDNGNDFQPVIPFRRKRKHPLDAVDHPVALWLEIAVFMPATATESSDPFTGPKTRKRSSLQILSGTPMVICATCGQEGHSWASDKQCEKHKACRKTACALKRTSIIKTSLENTCKDPDLVYSIRFAVKHVHDVSYAGSLFANYYTLWLLKLGKELPIISHDLYYNMFATIAGTGNSDELLKAAFKQFKDGSLMRKDEYYLGKITVAERKAVAQHVYNQVAEISTETSKWPSLVKDDEILKKAAKRIITSLCFGPGPITDVELNATPHLYIPWMYTILQRLEQNIFIQEEQPQDHVSAAYVHRNVHESLPNTEWVKLLDFVQSTL